MTAILPDDVLRSTESRRAAWTLDEKVVYLNHGSFGPSPRVVQEARTRWTAELERNPMDFFVRRMEPALDEALAVLGRFVGADPSRLAFVDNATTGVNAVAANVPLGPGDEVLLTDHEYGAVRRIWQRACERSGARVVIRALPDPLRDAEETVAAVASGLTDRTKLVVASHVTSPTAVVLPVAGIVSRCRERGVPVCLDGPHAVAMRPLDLDGLDPDWYVASGHKWLSAPFGSGFLFVSRRRRGGMLAPVVTSWGGSLTGRPTRWQDEFHWSGTRDPAPFLAVPDAIRFLESVGLDTFRDATHRLAQEGRLRLESWSGRTALVPDDPTWYGSMVTVPLADADPETVSRSGRDPLQQALWDRHRIEVPIVLWKGRRCLRLSCHLYNSVADLDRLTAALDDLRDLLRTGAGVP